MSEQVAAMGEMLVRMAGVSEPSDQLRDESAADNWRSPLACQIADAVCSVHRSYELMCGACKDGSRQAAGRKLQRGAERRTAPRVAVCIPFELQPVSLSAGRPVPCGPRQSAVTRDLSDHGVGFRHDAPLPGGYAVATFDVFGQPVHLLLQQRWAIQQAEHAHLCGARFVALLGEELAPIPA
jgi:hypothetical protein